MCMVLSLINYSFIKIFEFKVVYINNQLIEIKINELTVLKVINSVDW